MKTLLEITKNNVSCHNVVNRWKIEFSFVFIGDVNGSVEAILNTLVTYSSQRCRLDLIHHGIGEVTLNDVETAQLFNGKSFTSTNL